MTLSWQSRAEKGDSNRHAHLGGEKKQPYFELKLENKRHKKVVITLNKKREANQ